MAGIFVEMRDAGQFFPDEDAAIRPLSLELLTIRQDPAIRRQSTDFVETRMAVRQCVSCLGILFGLSAAMAVSSVPARAAEEKPYVLKDGKVDKATYNGWRRYTESCLRCHGPDGAGSSYAPDLLESLKRISEDQFNEIVVNGRVNVSQAQQNVMPAFGTVEDVVLYLHDIYAYLKARSDGVLGRGRPPRIGDQ